MFSFLKTRKNGEAADKTNKDLLSELKLMNSNHLGEIKDAITGGNENMIEAINNGNLRIVEKLGEISGKLDR